MRFIDRDEIARVLTYERCIPIVRDAMIAFSTGETRQLLRAILPLSEGRLFGSMIGALGARAGFGAKLISVFHENFGTANPSHQGVVVLFEPKTGAPVCVLEAGEITAIRTAAASAVATDALARPDARRLVLFGYGLQARTHARAISKVRHLDEIIVWGRSHERATACAAELGAELSVPAHTEMRAEVAADADIICTVTSAHDPILRNAWVKPGTHINAVGSSYAGPSEIDNDLVARARFIADSREGVLAQGGEFLRAKAAGLVNDDHVVGEIGEVLAGRVPGRRSTDEITIYKSLGHIAQDLAAGWAIYSNRP